MRLTSCAGFLASIASGLSLAHAQTMNPPPPGPAAAPPPAGAAPSQPAPQPGTGYPPPTQPYPPPSSAPGGYPAAAPPPSGYPPAGSQPTYAEPAAPPGYQPQPYPQNPPNNAGYQYGQPQQPYEPPPPPPPREPESGSGFEMPEWSVRFDPLNWLIEGRLGLELEVALWKFLSVELVPIFVTGSTPPAFNFAFRDDNLSQASNGLGAMSGAALNAGFWLGGTPFRGYVLRVGLTNYGYTYAGDYEFAGVVRHDEVSHTERHFSALIGSHARWGFFTLAGGFGIEYELNNQKRCFRSIPGTTNEVATEDCSDDGLLVIVDENDQGTVKVDLNNALYPVSLVGRISLGVVF